MSRVDFDKPLISDLTFYYSCMFLNGFRNMALWISRDFCMSLCRVK